VGAIVVLILGIETSCDETSVAVVENGRRIVVSHIASQVRIHAKFGGVVPELASRAHIQRLVPMIEACLDETGLTLEDMDCFAVTLGPGLVGALLVGVETAKTLAYAKGKPLVPVHHIAAHLYSPFLYATDGACRTVTLGADDDGDSSHNHGAVGSSTGADEPPPPLEYPHIGLAVSGGHTSLVLVHSPTGLKLLGETVDDAAGEAFDKVAKLLGLGYPGGPLVEAAARGGDRARFTLPRPMLAGSNLDFSFSGLKTAALKVVRDLGVEAFAGDPQLVADLCASFQEAVVETLLRKAGIALRAHGIAQLAVVGGVACNGRLREAAGRYLPDVRAVFPAPVLCTDNAAMVAGLAHHLLPGVPPRADLTLNARADLPLC
jgi:N6-L-threonylcarbamoyladenine synthase